MDKYNIIYADPPWDYNDKRDKHPRLCGGANVHYPTMKTKDIALLPIEQIAADNCMLFMWATFPNLPEAFALMKSWGFKYKTVGFTWIKTNKIQRPAEEYHPNHQIIGNNQTGFSAPFFGICYYTKSNAEVCLIGVKGKPIKISNDISSVILSPKEEHSKKPDIVREKIVQLCGDIPRIELFARNATEGWSVFGNEVSNSIAL
jgi:site-specific DNA-methyltransferase (adenine-specific)